MWTHSNNLCSLTTKTRWVSCKLGGRGELRKQQVGCITLDITELKCSWSRQFSTLMFRHSSIWQLSCFHVIRTKFNNCLLNEWLINKCSTLQALSQPCWICPLSWSTASLISLKQPDAQPLEWKKHHQNNLNWFLKTNEREFVLYMVSFQICAWKPQCSSVLTDSSTSTFSLIMNGVPATIWSGWCRLWKSSDPPGNQPKLHPSLSANPSLNSTKPSWQAAFPANSVLPLTINNRTPQELPLKVCLFIKNCLQNSQVAKVKYRSKSKLAQVNVTWYIYICLLFV